MGFFRFKNQHLKVKYRHSVRQLNFSWRWVEVTFWNEHSVKPLSLSSCDSSQRESPCFLLLVIVTKQSVCWEIPQQSENAVQKYTRFVFSSSFTLPFQLYKYVTFFRKLLKYHFNITAAWPMLCLSVGSQCNFLVPWTFFIRFYRRRNWWAACFG